MKTTPSQERNIVLQELSARVANRNWKLVDKVNQQESRELFCVPTPAKPSIPEIEIVWSR